MEKPATSSLLALLLLLLLFFLRRSDAAGAFSELVCERQPSHSDDSLRREGIYSYLTERR